MFVSNSFKARFVFAIGVLVLIGSVIVPHFAYAADLQNANAETYEKDIEYYGINPDEEVDKVAADEEATFSEFMENSEAIKTMEMLGVAGFALSPLLLAAVVLLVIYLIREKRN